MLHQIALTKVVLFAPDQFGWLVGPPSEAPVVVPGPRVPVDPVSEGSVCAAEVPAWGQVGQPSTPRMSWRLHEAPTL